MAQPTKAEMAACLEEIIERSDVEEVVRDIARRALGRKDTVNNTRLAVCLECFETPAGPEDTLADDLEVIVTYRGKPVTVSSFELESFDCERLEDQDQNDGEEEDDEEE